MPYSAQHKAKARERIVVSARELFNRRGFAEVSIDEIMRRARLTRGGFYNHFKNKEELFVEAIVDYGRSNPCERWENIELDYSLSGAAFGRQLLEAYLSREHLGDIEGQCPLIALPSDVARASSRVRQSYQRLLESMAGIFAATAPPGSKKRSLDHGLALTALCVGGMILARTSDDPEFRERIRCAAQTLARELAGPIPARRAKRQSADAAAMAEKAEAPCELGCPATTGAADDTPSRRQERSQPGRGQSA